MLTPAQSRVQEQVRQRQALCHQIKEVIVDALTLDVDPDWLTDDQVILGRGMQMDSVDVIDVVLGIEATFKISIGDEELDRLASINLLADHIQSRREGA